MHSGFLQCEQATPQGRCEWLSQASLTPAALAAALTPAALAQKDMIGARLFPKVAVHFPLDKIQPMAREVTGMLLEMDNCLLLEMLDCDDKLEAKIHEIMETVCARMDARMESCAREEREKAAQQVAPCEAKHFQSDDQKQSAWGWI